MLNLCFCQNNRMFFFQNWNVKCIKKRKWFYTAIYTFRGGKTIKLTQNNSFHALPKVEVKVWKGRKYKEQDFTRPRLSKETMCKKYCFCNHLNAYWAAKGISLIIIFI